MYSHCSHYHGNLPLAFTDYFSRNDTIDKHNNRSSTKLHINYKRKKKFSIKYVEGQKLRTACQPN